MNGAEKLIETARDGGVEVCFTNPGTTEMLLVAALDSVPGVRAVLAMFEGVVTGAADGYGRMADKPAMTLLHLGPGFANGMANLHNARRARSPVLNLIGHHATWIRNYDPPLNTDIETIAAGVSNWQRTSASSDHISRDTAEALSAALSGSGQIATLVVPGDVQWDKAPEGVVAVPAGRSGRVCDDAIERARCAVQAGAKTLLFLGQSGLRESGLKAAGRIAKKTGCHLMAETFAKRMERGPHLPSVPRLPYFPEQAVETLQEYDQVVLVGAKDPVAFFAYEGGVARLAPSGTEVISLAAPDEDSGFALDWLAEELGCSAEFATPTLARPDQPSGEINPLSIAQSLVANMPENCIVVDEGVTSSGAFYPLAATAPPHSYLQLTGGAIGWGLPASIGAAIACPDRHVLALEGDGSGFYTCQSFWTQARENLKIVNVIFNNSVYRILQVELHRAGVTEPGPQSLAMTELNRPTINWVELSQSMGVPATSVTTAEELNVALQAAFDEQGPMTIEVIVPASGPVAAP